MGQNKKKFSLVLVKPSHYDDDGYVIQWFRSSMPANSLACLYGLAVECDKEKILGENTELEIVGNTKNQSIAKRISLINGTVRAQVENQKNKDFIVQTSVSVASVKGTDFWVISDKSKGDSIIGIEGVIQLANKISGEIIDIRKGITGLSSNNGKLESFNTDPKTIPNDPSGDDTVNQKIRIELIDASGKKKILVIEYQ